jgi:hypothetical protein
MEKALTRRDVAGSDGKRSVTNDCASDDDSDGGTVL